MTGYERKAFLAAAPADIPAMCAGLANVISRRLGESAEFHAAGYAVIEELRAAGHPLWSFDEGPDFQAWCDDWTKPIGGPTLTLSLSAPNYVEASWGVPEQNVSAEAGSPADAG